MASTMYRRQNFRPSSGPAAARRRKVVSPTLLARKTAALSPSSSGGEAKPAAVRRPQRCRSATHTAALQPGCARRRPAVHVVAALPAATAASSHAASSGGAAAAGVDGGALTVTARVVVPYRPTTHGQQMVLVGGCEALGNWDPKEGVRFTWCEGHSHVAEVELPIHFSIACKLVVLGDNGQAAWEPGPDRELLLAPTSLSARAAGYTMLCHWSFPDCTQLLPNSLRRGGGGGSPARKANGHHHRQHAAAKPASGAGDNPIIAGVKRALAHASSTRERLAVIPGITSSWEEESGAAAGSGASFEEEEEVTVAQCQVTVLVPPSGPKLKPEQSLVLVGSSPALGRWDPAQGLPLERLGEESPVWAAQAELPLGEGLQAKVVVVDAVSGEAQVWEPCENRSLPRDLGATRPVMITAYWGAAPTHCMEVDRLGVGGVGAVAAAAGGGSPHVVQVLRQQLAATSSQLDGLRKERDEARKAVAASEEHMRRLDGEARSLAGSGGGGGRQDLVQLADQLTTTRRLYETTKKEAMQLGGTVGVTRQLCEAAKRELSGLAHQLEAAKRAYEALAPQVERMERQLASTSRAFEATKPELLALEAQLDRARSMFERTLQKIEAAKALSAGGEVDPSAMAAAVAAAARRRGESSSTARVREREVQLARHY